VPPDLGQRWCAPIIEEGADFFYVPWSLCTLPPIWMKGLPCEQSCLQGQGEVRLHVCLVACKRIGHGGEWRGGKHHHPWPAQASDLFIPMRSTSHACSAPPSGKTARKLISGPCPVVVLLWGCGCAMCCCRSAPKSLFSAGVSAWKCRLRCVPLLLLLLLMLLMLLLLLLLVSWAGRLHTATGASWQVTYTFCTCCLCALQGGPLTLGHWLPPRCARCWWWWWWKWWCWQRWWWW